MQQEHFKLVTGAFLILTKNDKILMLRRFNTGYGDGKYSLPAGHIDGKEPATAAMVREAKEEAGITIDPKNLSLVHIMHLMTNRESINLFFTSSVWEGEVQNCEPDKCDDLSWFPITSLPDNAIPYVKKALEHWQTSIVFSEFGWK